MKHSHGTLKKVAEIQLKPQKRDYLKEYNDWRGLEKAAYDRKDIDSVIIIRMEIRSMMNDIPSKIGTLVINDSMGRKTYQLRIAELSDGELYIIGDIRMSKCVKNIDDTYSLSEF